MAQMDRSEQNRATSSPDTGKKTTVLFDVDGTLCDTNYLHTVCWHQALVETENETVPMHEIHALMGVGSDQLTKKLIGRNSDPATKAHSRLYEKHWDDVSCFDGIRPLFEAIDKRGVEIVLASSADGDELAMLKKKIGRDDLIVDSTSSKDVQTTKPEPDIFTKALEQAATTPNRAVVIGDSRWDMIAAGKAGIDAYGVLTGGIAAELLIEAGAKEVFSNLKDLAKRLDEILNK